MEIRTIAIIGAGNMGGATAAGLAQGTAVERGDIRVANRGAAKLEALAKRCPGIFTTQSNVEAAEGSDLVILAVKPWVIEGVVEEIMPHIDPARQIVASMVGGLPLGELREMVERHQPEGATTPPLTVIIPNTAIEVRQSMTFIQTDIADEATTGRLLEIFKELGDAMLADGRQLAAGMAMASCGIAYAMRWARAMQQGGVRLGFYPGDALRVALKTMEGAAALLQATGRHPEEEIDRVTTPGGITVKGLQAMEEAGFSTAVLKALLASTR